MRHLSWIIVLVITVLGCNRAFGEDPKAPTTQPASIGDVRTQTVQAFTYFYITKDATFANIGKIAEAELPKLFAAMKGKGLTAAGPTVFIYHGATEDMKKPFKLDLGIQVEPDSPAVAGYQLGKIPATESATILFTGNVKELGRAYGKLFSTIQERNLTPTSEAREYYFYWEGPAAANNIVWVVAPLQHQP